MKLLVFSVRDLKASAYMQPFFMQKIGQAMRAFGDTVQDGKSVLGKHPEDFELFKIGEFDDESGELKTMKPEYIARAGDFVVPVKGE